MKTIFIFLAVCAVSIQQSSCQNRLANWNIDKITSLKIERKTMGEKVKVIEFVKKAQIDTILSFLKKVNFRRVDTYDINKTHILNQWRYKMTFQGYGDQVWLMKNYATIGKTTFLVNKEVIVDLDRLIAKCSKSY